MCKGKRFLEKNIKYYLNVVKKDQCTPHLVTVLSACITSQLMAAQWSCSPEYHTKFQSSSYSKFQKNTTGQLN